MRRVPTNKSTSILNERLNMQFKLMILGADIGIHKTSYELASVKSTLYFRNMDKWGELVTVFDRSDIPSHGVSTSGLRLRSKITSARLLDTQKCEYLRDIVAI
jgi:hypothetical protein